MIRFNDFKIAVGFGIIVVLLQDIGLRYADVRLDYAEQMLTFAAAVVVYLAMIKKRWIK